MAPLQVAGSEVVEHQSAVAQVALGEPSFDRVLTLVQPIHGGVGGVLVDLTESELGGQRVAHGGGVQAACGGQLGAGAEDPGKDQGESEIALLGWGTEQAVEADGAGQAVDGGDMAVGLGADDIEGVMEGVEGKAALEEDAQAIDDVRGQLGEVGEGTFLDFAVLAVGLAEEYSGSGVAVGDALDVHGYPTKEATEEFE